MYRTRVQTFMPIGVTLLGFCLLAFSAIGCVKKTVEQAEAQKPQVPVPAPPGKAWALVIGVQQYEHAGQVKYARADAKGTGDLLALQGFQVTALYDQQATKNAIESALQDLLVKRAGAEDRVVIFFAGRGDTRSASGGKRAYLLPTDAELTDVLQTAITVDQVRAWAEASRARHVLLIVATSLGSHEGRPALGKADLRADAVKVLMSQRGAHVITAALPEETPVDVAEWSHGLFTHYLLEGLGGGEADTNRDGIVLASELFMYLEQNIAVASQIRGRTQHPQFWALTEGDGEMLFIPSRSRNQLPDVSPDTPGSLAVREMETQLLALEQSLEELEAQKPKGPPSDETGSAIVQQIKQTQKQLDDMRARYLQARLLAGHDMVSQDGSRMVLVPAGEFLMGEDTKQYAVGDPAYNYAPYHKVYVDEFYIDKYEVTAGQYAKFLQDVKRPEPRFWNDMKLDRDERRPVIGVSWDDANEYCRWAGKRLPTEAEWEKAARGTDGRKYPWGNSEPTRSLANFDWYGIRTWQGYQSLLPVGGYDAGRSPYGAYDMAGSVWEWVSDWYGRNYYLDGPKQNPKGPSTGKERVVKGGSWRHPPELLRSSYRHHYQPSVLPFTYLGFRCAQGLSK